MIIRGLNFNPKLTVLTHLKVKQLATRYGVNDNKMTTPEWLNFMTATFCDDPDRYLDLDIEEFDLVNSELGKTEEYQRAINQLKRISNPGKKLKGKTHE